MITYRQLALVGAVLVLGACNKMGDKKVELKTDEQKFSYGVGLQIGGGMKSQGVKVDVDALALAISDALSGTSPRVNEQELQAAMVKVQQGLIDKRTTEGKANLDKGKTFLAENGKKTGIKTTKSGLQYEVITEGKGVLPKDASVVSVNYKGTLIDGSEFDSSYKRGKPAEFPVNGVIPGWTEALKLMKVGSKYKLYVPSDLAYGEGGRPGIPPNSVLIFEVELLDIKKS